MRPSVSSKHLFWLIITLSLLVRVWGIKHGLPFIYHPDEPALVRSAYGLRFGNLNPGHFDWPHLHYYLCFFIFESFIKFRALLQVLHLRPLLEPLAPLLWQDPAIFYFLARLVSALAGTATVGLTYLIGKKLFGKKVGLVAALFLALSPLHVDQSHYALLDVALTFWISLSFYFSTLILEKGRLRDYLLAGLFAGFAASTKYNGALVVAAIVAAHLLCKAGPCGKRKLLLSGLVSIAGFLLGTPYALLDRKTFLFREDARGFLWQLEGMKGHLGAEALNGWWFYFATTLRRGLGVVLLGLVVLGIVQALVRHRRRDLLLLSFPLLYFFYVGSWTVVYGRFMIPILPMLCILAAGFVSCIATEASRLLSFRADPERAERVEGEVEKSRPKAASSNASLDLSTPPRLRSGSLEMTMWSKIALVTLLLLTLTQPVWEVIKSDYILTQMDTRTLAKTWIDANLPDKSKIAMDTIYGFFLDPFYLPNLRKTKGADDPEKGFYLLPWSKISETTPHENPEKFLADWKEEGVDYLVVSSLVYGRYFSQTTEQLRPGVKQVQADYLWFDENFKLLKEVSPDDVRPGPVIKVYQVKQ